jgi:hypothetical protein
MSFVWRTGAAGETHLSTPAELGPRIGITCQVALGFVYFRARPPHVQELRRGRAQGARRAAPGGRARSSLRPRARNGCAVAMNARTNWRAAPRAEEDGATTREGGRGRSRASDDGVEEKARTQTGNELGLSGMDRKREATVTVTNGGDPANDSYSSLGM